MRKLTNNSIMTFLVMVLLGALFASPAFAGKEVERFQFPDVRDDFCGLYINFQYCKCAFHNDYCEDVALSRSGASSYVWEEYRNWVRGQINNMARTCIAQNGIWSVSGRSCTYCTPPHVNVDNRCVKADEEQGEEENGVRESSDTTKDCDLPDDFNDNWEKYSDIDELIETQSRSYEAQQYTSLIEQIVQKKAEVYNYKVAMEADRLARLELRNIKKALVQNIKVNLLKSFWRLSYITYTTIKSGASTGQTYADMLNPDSVVQGIAKGISVIQANVPSDSALAIDTSDASGKVRSIGANAALEAMDSLGDPKKVALKVFDDSVKSTFPSADITPEEIEILKNQHLRNNALDMKIMESYLINSQRRTNVLELEKEIALLQAQAHDWKQKERARVRDMILESCNDN
jgi:hypothetical protein